MNWPLFLIVAFLLLAIAYIITLLEKINDFIEKFKKKGEIKFDIMLDPDDIAKDVVSYLEEHFKKQEGTNQ